jgi:hypothetical protein
VKATAPASFSVVADSKDEIRAFLLDDGVLALSGGRAFWVGAGSVEPDAKLVEAVGRGLVIAAAKGTLKDPHVVAGSVDSSGTAAWRGFVRRGSAWTAVPREKDPRPPSPPETREIKLRGGSVVKAPAPVEDCPTPGDRRRRYDAAVSADGTVYALGTVCGHGPSVGWVLEVWKEGKAPPVTSPIPDAPPAGWVRRALLTLGAGGLVWAHVTSDRRDDAEFLARFDGGAWANVTLKGEAQELRFLEGGRTVIGTSAAAYVRLRSPGTTWTPLGGGPSPYAVKLLVTRDSGALTATTDPSIFEIDAGGAAWEPRAPPVTSDGQPIEPASIRLLGALADGTSVLQGKSKDRAAILWSGSHRAAALDSPAAPR